MVQLFPGIEQQGNRKAGSFGNEAEEESKKEEGGRRDCRMGNDTKKDGRRVGTVGESGIHPRTREQGERGKKMERSERRMVFCGGGCNSFVGHESPGCQGAPI